MSTRAFRAAGRVCGVRRWYRMRTAELSRAVCRVMAARRIQRRWRVLRRSKERALIRLQRWWRECCRYLPANERDPITQIEVRSLPPARRFWLFENNGVCNVHDARHLASYIRTTGCAQCPITMRPLTGVELVRLSRVSGVSLNNEWLRIVKTRNMERLSVVASLERELAETVERTMQSLARGGTADELNALGGTLYQCIHDLAAVDPSALDLSVRMAVYSVQRAIALQDIDEHDAHILLNQLRYL